MSPNEAIQIVKSKAEGRTRYDGQPAFLDEVLVAEIERLRRFIQNDYDQFKSCHPYAVRLRKQYPWLSEAAEAKSCQHEWIPRQDYGFDICRKCKAVR